MKTFCLFLVFLGCGFARCESTNDPYGFTWAIATLAYTAYDTAKCGLMKHVYAAPGSTYPDFETVIAKTEKTSFVSPEFYPSPNFTTDHAFLFKYEGRKAIYFGRFVQETNHQSEFATIFSVGEITNLPSFIARLKTSSNLVSAFLISRFSESARSAIIGFPESHMDEKALEVLLVKELNTMVLGPSIYDENRFRGVVLRPGTRRLLNVHLNPPPGLRISRQQMTAMLNRMLLDDAYPSSLPIQRMNKFRMRTYVAIQY